MSIVEIEEALAAGESSSVEFKSEYSSDMGKDICAFANASGGKVILGVSDSGTVVGIEVTNKLKGDIGSLADNCDPPVHVKIREYLLTKGGQDKKVLVVTAEESSGKPHTYNKTFYIRRVASNKRMLRSEIIEMAGKKGLIEFDTVPCEDFDYQNDFDADKLFRFLEKASLPIPNKDGILSSLESLRVVSIDKKRSSPVFNNAGVLFFAKDLGKTFWHTEVACALYKGKDKTAKIIDSIRLNSDLISTVEGAMAFLLKSLRLEYRIVSGQLQREEILEIPEDALREALINAVTHRDYLSKRNNVTIEVYDNRVEISNYGGLPEELDEKDFGKKSVLRNRLIADLMSRAKYIERYGTGVNKMKKLVKLAGLPPVKFEFGKFFTVVFKRKVYRRTARSKHSPFKQSQRALKLLAAIKNNTFSKAAFAESEKVSQRAVERDLKSLKDQGLIAFEGGVKTGRYQITGKMAVIRVFVEKAKAAVGLDAHAHAKDIVEATSLDIDDVMRVIEELEQEELIHVLTRSAEAEVGETLVGAKGLLFTKFDHLWKPWNPADDAWEIALSYSHHPDFPTDPKRVAEVLNLPPRRLNPAINYLMEHKLVKGHSARGIYPFTVSRMYPNRENIAEFLKKR